MRILKLGVYYPAYLEQFYGARPGLERQDHATQHAALLEDAFGSSYFWTSALRNLGHDTTDLVLNAEPLQRAWAREHHLPWPGDDWPFAVSLEQVKAFRPDVLLVADYSTVTYAFLRQLQNECPSIRLTVIWCGAPYRDGEVFRACDVVLSCVPELVDDFRAQGHRAVHMNHAFEPRVLESLPAVPEPSVDFSFLGSLVLAGSFHRQRARILEALVRETNLRIWSDVSRPSLRRRAGQRARILAFDAAEKARRLGIPQQVLAPIPLIGRASRWAARPESIRTHGPRIVERAQKPLYGLAMFQQLRDSRVTLNTHIEISRQSASNMRMFEATGVGTCLLTDWKERLPDLFEPDAEVVTYSSAEECVEKVRYLLAHESERASIAAAGQRRTLRDHTFAHRAAQLDAILAEALSGNAKRSTHTEPRGAAPAIDLPPSDTAGPLRVMARKIRQALRGRGRSSASFEEVERVERQFYLDTVRDGMIVFDVGAHVGELTLLFSRCAGSGRVHAFEAGRSSFERLSAACRASGRDNVPAASPRGLRSGGGDRAACVRRRAPRLEHAGAAPARDLRHRREAGRHRARPGHHVGSLLRDAPRRAHRSAQDRRRGSRAAGAPGRATIAGRATHPLSDVRVRADHVRHGQHARSDRGTARRQRLHDPQHSGRRRRVSGPRECPDRAVRDACGHTNATGMIPLVPTPTADHACPHCEVMLDVRGGYIPGMRNLARLHCSRCGREFYGDLRSGQAFFTPQLLERATGIVHDPHGVPWFSAWLRESYANRVEMSREWRVVEHRAVTRPVVFLNCLDTLYGHVLLKLLNAQALLERPDLDLIVMVPATFAWLVPDGAAQVWLVDLPLKQGTEWNDGLAKEIARRLDSFPEVWLSVAHSHPRWEDFAIERFTRVLPFPLAQWAERAQQPVITFLWRDDRTWPSGGVAALTARARSKVSAQVRQVKRFWKALQRELSDVDFAVAGLGKAGGLPPSVRDLRRPSLDDATERAWCERYAASHLVIGVHGSNMLLPSAHAGGVIELLPRDRWGNYLQDLLLRPTSTRELLFRTRIVAESTAPEEVALMATQIVRGVPRFRELMGEEKLSRCAASAAS